MASPLQMKFKRYGRSHQVVLGSASELFESVTLDEALWAATSAPVATMDEDPGFLSLVDADGNGRITCSEVKDAIRWLSGVLRDTEGVMAASRSLEMDAIDGDTPDGGRCRRAAEKMVERVGTGDVLQLGVVRSVRAELESAPVSGAGVVLPEAAGDAVVRGLMVDVVAATGGVDHPSGAKGVDEDRLAGFLAAASAFLRWRGDGDIPDGLDRTDIMPLGTDTFAAYAIFSAVRPKLEQYFAQCQMLAMDTRFAQRMGWTQSELAELDLDDLAVIEQVLARTPLAVPTVDGELAFDGRINTHYAASLERFRHQVADPILGLSPERLSGAQWSRIKSAFAAHEAWIKAKAGAEVDGIDRHRLQAHLVGDGAKAVRDLITASRAASLVLDNVRLVEKLLLYQAHLADLARNFISFPYLYDPDRRAMFEMGALVMDGRRFHLSVRVADRGKHADIAKTSNMFLMYVAVAPSGGEKPYEVAVPVTGGGKGNLCVGKRGVFFDTAGREWPAVVVGIIENPISVGEALVSPFKRIGRMVTGKIESIAARAEKKLDARTTTALDQIDPGDEKVAGRPQQDPSQKAGWLIVGGGAAMAALGSALAYVTKTLADTDRWAIVTGVIVAALAVVLPTSIIAILKLRKRDLSAILEGSGWGVNARMRLTRRLSKFFTDRPGLPTAGRRKLASWRRWLWVIALVALHLFIAWRLIDRYLL